MARRGEAGMSTKPALPPPWVRRCDWKFYGNEVDFYFPGLDQACRGPRAAPAL
jgi:hypothetical protein